MTVFELLSLNTLISLINCLTFGHYDLSVWTNATFTSSPMYFVIKLPQLNDSIIGTKHLNTTLFIVNEFYGIYLFVQFNRFKMIKLRFMTLNFCIVSVVEVSTVLEFYVFEDNNSTTFVSYSKILACFIE